MTYLLLAGPRPPLLNEHPPCSGVAGGSRDSHGAVLRREDVGCRCRRAVIDSASNETERNLDRRASELPANVDGPGRDARVIERAPDDLTATKFRAANDNLRKRQSSSLLLV